MTVIDPTVQAKAPPPQKYYFLEELRIQQRRRKDNTEKTLYSVFLSYRMFGESSDGVFDYAPKNQTINVPDYLADAMVKAAQGDMDMLNALGAIEAAFAKIIQDQTGQSAEVL